MKLHKMRSLGVVLISLILNLPTHAQRPQDALMKEAAGKVVEALKGFKEEHAAWFVPEFFEKVQKDHLAAGLKKNGEELGEIQRTRIVRITEPYAAEVEFISKSHRRLYATIRLEPKPPHRITYLFFSHLDLARDTWDGLLFDVQKFPGQVGASVWRLTPTMRSLLAHNTDRPLAVGSSFKLMLLSTLADEVAAGKRKWADVVTLRDEWKSLPSGMLHEWPACTPVTLHTLATMMVARSDNTAADHLFRTLGRDAIEAQQKKVKVQDPERNLPFLCTSELFKLKLIEPPERLKQYAAADETERRKIVASLAEVKLTSPRTLTAPLLIDQVEWFFTTDDVCRLLDGFRRSKVQADVLPLLAITRPFEIDDYEWEYLGFKGGAEAGVLNLSLLGKLRRTQEWYAFAFTWNRTDQLIDEPSWLRHVQRAVQLAEREGGK